MILVLDNYDSFTYNLVQRLGEIDSRLEICVVRNDEMAVEQLEKLAPERIIISPGPGTPYDAGVSMDVVAHFGPRLPLLGVCLGHQCIAEVFKASVVRAGRLMHGKTSMVYHDRRSVFAGLPSPFEATRYHSLVVPEESLTADLELTAWTDDPGFPREVMGLRHRRYPIHGVQFHPESFLTSAGIDLLRNFLCLPAGDVAKAASTSA
jgi:anthranilate synthase component 2